MERKSSRCNLAPDVGRLVFRCRNVMAPITLLLVVVASRHPGDFLASPWADHWLDALGTIAIAVGLVIRFLVVAGSGIRRSGVHKEVIAPTLFESGPYAWCRNPLYLANATILVGLSLLFESRWMVCIALPTALLAIHSLVATEERVLAESYGDRYRHYCRRVPRFVPRHLSTLWAAPLDWRRALRKEHATMFAALTTAVVLRAAEDHVRTGLAWRDLDRSLPCVWLVAATLWGIVRYLKRTGRLDSRPTPPAPRAPAPSLPPPAVPSSRLPVGDIVA